MTVISNVLAENPLGVLVVVFFYSFNTATMEDTPMVDDTHWYAHTCIIKSHGFHTSSDSEITGVSIYSSFVQQSCDPIHVHVYVTIAILDQSIDSRRGRGIGNAHILTIVKLCFMCVTVR